MARDDFSQRTKDLLAKRVGYRCSNPACGCATVFPGKKDDRNASIIGQAAHIAAASPRGSRYDANMDSRQRSNIDNGIWLCNKCARLIDMDEKNIQWNCCVSGKMMQRKCNGVEPLSM